MEELTLKVKNISGKTLSPGAVVYKVKENKFYSFLTKIGLRTARVNLAEVNDFDAMHDWYLMKDGEIAVKSHTIKNIDMSDFNTGETLCLSDALPGALVTYKL